jgi:drug/metabolite transporter (DMT)-like permease
MTFASASAVATALILVSALLHAIVNALVKVSDDGLLTRGFMNATAFALALPCVAFVPVPTGDQWQLLALAVAVHGLYPFFLVAAYRHGDLSAAYPVARGVVPLAVAGLSALLPGLGPRVATLPFLVLVSIGVGAFALERAGTRGPAYRRGLLWAAGTGLIVATYTLIDAAGLRMGATPATYIVWLLLLDGLFVSGTVALARRGRLRSFAQRHWRKAIVAGLLGVAGYGLALAALALGRVAEIAALRETSVVFAAVIGSVVLGEKFGWVRCAATALVFAGVVGIRVAG